MWLHTKNICNIYGYIFRYVYRYIDLLSYFFCQDAEDWWQYPFWFSYGQRRTCFEWFIGTPNVLERTCAKYQMAPDATLYEVSQMYGSDVIGLTQVFHRMINHMMEDTNVSDPSMRPIILRMQTLMGAARIPRVLLDLAHDRAPVPEDRIRNPRM